MFRKSIFLGLMVMLGASIVYLIISGRRRERLEQQSPHPVEIIQNAKPSATRIYAPDDLRILSVRREGGADASAPAAFIIEVRNNGSVAYANLLTKLTCSEGKDKASETRDCQLKEPALPAKTTVYQNIAIEPAVGEAARCSGRIIYADINLASTQ